MGHNDPIITESEKEGDLLDAIDADHEGDASEYSEFDSEGYEVRNLPKMLENYIFDTDDILDLETNFKQLVPIKEVGVNDNYFKVQYLLSIYRIFAFENTNTK